ncbi:MAG TPA: methyltransferase [Nitrolancea sp.]|nr:methyltransferase [Nitrolancea sp.]
MGGRKQPPAGGGTRRGERIDLQLGKFDRDGTIPVVASGRRIQIEGGIPTETVRVAIQGQGTHWRGRILAVLDHAPERATPACPVVDVCGGCEWQHLDQAGQLKHKAAILRRLLSARRLPTRIDEIVPMPEPWRYRVRAQIALGTHAGFRELRSKRIVRLTACPVVHPLIDRLLEQINRLLKLGDLPDFGGKLILHAQVVGPEDDRRLQLLLDGPAAIHSASMPIEEIASALGQLRGVHSVADRDPQGVVRPLVGELFAPVGIGQHTYFLPAGSFFQSNLQLLPALLSRVRQLAALSGSEEVVDLYAGIGLFGLALSDQAGHVTAIEIDPLAIEAARNTVRAWGRANIDLIAAPAEDAIAGLPSVDRVIVDPPRTGLDRRVIETLIAREPGAIIYVSCNPATFARDAAAFVRAGYAIEHLSLFDFYPQTVHVEVVAKLAKVTAG